jgi:hypothetical protein
MSGKNLFGFGFFGFFLENKGLGFGFFGFYPEKTHLDFGFFGLCLEKNCLGLGFLGSFQKKRVWVFGLFPEKIGLDFWGVRWYFLLERTQKNSNPNFLGFGFVFFGFFLE